MNSCKNSQRIAIVALLGATTLHLVLIAAATVWQTAPARPEPPDPILSVALHRPAALAVVAPAGMPAAPPQARNSVPPTPRPAVRRQKTQPRPPAAAPAPDTRAAAQQPQIAAPEPSGTQNRTPDSSPAATLEAPPVAVKTGVSIPAAYAARNRKPDYPLRSRRYNEQGTVTLRVLVNADGTAGAVHIKQSSAYPLLDQSALAAARSWRFVAATQDGKPVSEWYEISIPYTLQD